MAVIAPNGPYEIRATLPSPSLLRLPLSPGPRDSPSLALSAACGACSGRAGLPGILQGQDLPFRERVAGA